jgi:hypothetical protein
MACGKQVQMKYADQMHARGRAKNVTTSEGSLGSPFPGVRILPSNYLHRFCNFLSYWSVYKERETLQPPKFIGLARDHCIATLLVHHRSATAWPALDWTGLYIIERMTTMPSLQSFVGMRAQGVKHNFIFAVAFALDGAWEENAGSLHIPHPPTRPNLLSMFQEKPHYGRR